MEQAWSFFPKRPPGSYRGGRTLDMKGARRERARERMDIVLGKTGAHVMYTALEYREWVTHLLYALSLEEKDHRGVRVSVSRVFGVCYRAISPLAALPESAAEETALMLGKRSSHQGNSCCIQVGLDAQRKAAEDRVGGDSRPGTSHTGPLWVTICKSLVVHL